MTVRQQGHTSGVAGEGRCEMGQVFDSRCRQIDSPPKYCWSSAPEGSEESAPRPGKAAVNQQANKSGAGSEPSTGFEQ